MKLKDYIGIVSSLLILNNPLSAQEGNLEVKTKVCESNLKEIPVTVIARDNKPIYAVMDLYMYNFGFSPVIKPWEITKQTLINPVVLGSQNPEESSCRWAKAGEEFSRFGGYVSENQVKIKGNKVYVSKGSQKIELSLPRN